MKSRKMRIPEVLYSIGEKLLGLQYIAAYRSRYWLIALVWVDQRLSSSDY